VAEVPNEPDHRVEELPGFRLRAAE
jgi:hypothetical protein